MKTVFATLVWTFFLSTFLGAAEPSWPMFHGPKGDNISSETGLLDSWPEDGPKLLWKAEGLGNTNEPGYSGVVVADGRAFTTGNVKVADSDKTADATVFAVDVRTGKTLWQYNNGSGWTGHYPGDRGTPTVDGDRVYALSAMGRLVCLAAASGEKIWDRNLLEDFAVRLPTWAFAESVVVDGEKIVCWPGGTKAAVVALDKMTGKTIWTTPSTGQLGGYSTMAIFEQDGLRIYANMNQKGLLAVNGKTGKQLFFHPHETQYDINATIPYYKDGKILLSSGYGTGTELLQLKVEGEKASVERKWSQKKLDNQHGGLIVRDGYIYGSAHHYKRGVWMCLKWDDGSIAWENRGVGQGSLSFADGKFYCMGEKEGTVALVAPNPEKYEEISRFTLPEEGAGMFWAHPVICDKKLYLRHAGFLYCYDIAK